MRLTAHEWQTAQHVCTPEQLAALDYWRRGERIGYKRIAVCLGISRDAARGRIDRALHAIDRAHTKEAA